MKSNEIKTKNLQRDYIGMWFDARKELGISNAMRIGTLNIKTNDVEWTSCSHGSCDGLGFLVNLLRRDGYACNKVPMSSDARAPSFWGFVKLLLSMPKQDKNKHITWKYHRSVAATEKGHFEYNFFSEEQTKTIKSMAKKCRVTLNHYVLWALNKAIAKSLLDSQQDYYWLYPVNLRGPLDFGTDYFNYSSTVNVCVNNAISASGIHGRVKEQLKSKVYWVNWRMANIGKYIGMAGIRLIYKRMSKKQFFAGSFSFLGSWPLNEEGDPPNNPDKIYILNGIGTANYPISTGIILWYGRLSLGLGLHSSIYENSDIVKTCLNDWMEFLLHGEGA